MMKSVTFLLVILISSAILNCHLVFAADSSGQWKITSVKVCRNPSGTINSSVEVVGSFPVYSFFVPRPVWTVNGTVVDTQPVYDRGRLVAFQLINAAGLLNSGSKNTVKFSLPDQSSSKVFHYDQNKASAGSCYEFF
ncbi:MAG: hypothetical protein HY912_09875 [Desulfomonile tiedjei]|uniref:Uncharacterized protein n=1 Tax=Desulfomonile tiedjei TaxID=2358 RepID=A0A9D6Z0C2_9BACT|nr:hypothetical protein [Desulfomonile tiedjei]